MSTCRNNKTNASDYERKNTNQAANKCKSPFVRGYIEERFSGTHNEIGELKHALKNL